MSAEFFIERNENSIEFAAKNMQRTMDTFRDLVDYIAEVEEVYENVPKGKDELGKMFTIAQCIASKPFDNADEDVQAAYYGEVIGLEFINYLETGHGDFYKTGFAKSFMALQVNLDMLTFENVESEEAWRARISKSIQQDLSEPLETHGLSAQYESFGRRAAQRLSANEAHQELAMMGFRMVITEALKPPLVEAEEDETSYSSHSASSKLAKQSITAQKVHFPSIEETEAVFGNLENLIVPEWGNITHVRTALYKKYKQLNASDEEEQLSNLSTLASSDNHMKKRLNTFNSERKFIARDDWLRIKGQFFASGSGDRGFGLTDNDVEVRGVFESIVVVKVPSAQQLSSIIEYDEKLEMGMLDVTHFELTPAIRLANPILVSTTKDGTETTERFEGETIDVPLNYESIIFERFKTDDLEPEA